MRSRKRQCHATSTKQVVPTSSPRSRIRTCRAEHEPLREDLATQEDFVGQHVRRIAQKEHSRVVGVGRELVSYELWIYAGAGQPLFDSEAINLDTGLRILFVDTQGFGQYKLRKSSAKLPIYGIGATF